MGGILKERTIQRVASKVASLPRCNSTTRQNQPIWVSSLYIAVTFDTLITLKPDYWFSQTKPLKVVQQLSCFQNILLTAEFFFSNWKLPISFHWFRDILYLSSLSLEQPSLVCWRQRVLSGIWLHPLSLTDHLTNSTQNQGWD